MTKSRTLIIAAGLVGLGAVACVADDRPTIGERQYNQRERIENGAKPSDSATSRGRSPRIAARPWRTTGASTVASAATSGASRTT
jgi:hypothetical protein